VKSVEGAREILAEGMIHRPDGGARGSIRGNAWKDGVGVCTIICWSMSTGNSPKVGSFPSRIGMLSTFSFSEIDDRGMLLCCTINGVAARAGVGVVITGRGIWVYKGVEFEEVRRLCGR